jgi:hypothetical protein
VTGAPEVGFEVDTFHLVLLTHGPAATELDEAGQAGLVGEHIQHNLALQGAGHLIAGAVVGAATTGDLGSGQPLIGIGLYALPEDEAIRLTEEDPGVRAGLYRAEVARFMLPKGTIDFQVAARALPGGGPS